MARQINKLTVSQVHGFKPKDKQYKKADGGGLYLLIKPNGGKYWRYKFYFAGQEQNLALGTFPTTSLKEARIKKEEARRLKESGINPCIHRQEQKRALREQWTERENTFEKIAREWFEQQEKQWAESHSETVIRRLEKHVFPWIAQMPMTEIKAPTLAPIIKRIAEANKFDTATKVQQIIGQVFRYAVVTGVLEYDVTPTLKGIVSTPSQSHFPALTEPKAVAALLHNIDAYKGSFVTICALRLAPLVFLRPGNLRQAEWEDIDLKEKTWVIPSKKIKSSKEDLIISLPRQAVAILEEIKPLTGNRSQRYVFPGARSESRPMSENALNAALSNLGYKNIMVAHGFRAMARTMLSERLGISGDLVELQLSHRIGGTLGRAYNRTQFLKERREMLQAWADYLDELRRGNFGGFANQ